MQNPCRRQAITTLGANATTCRRQAIYILVSIHWSLDEFAGIVAPGASVGGREGGREVEGRRKGGREAGRGGGREGICRKGHVARDNSLSLSRSRSLSRSFALSLFRSLALAPSPCSITPPTPPPPVPTLLSPSLLYLSLYHSFSHPRALCVQLQGSRKYTQQRVRPRKVP